MKIELKIPTMDDKDGLKAVCNAVDRKYLSDRLHVDDQIGQTVSDQFKNLPTVSNGKQFSLSWLHYLKLRRISNIDEQYFYEIEAAKNDWSLSEMKCQFDSALSLYEMPATCSPKPSPINMGNVANPRKAKAELDRISFRYFCTFPLYSERNSPISVRTVPAPDIMVTFSFRIRAEVTTVITGTR